jgi:hypothetical protein
MIKNIKSHEKDILISISELSGFEDDIIATILKKNGNNIKNIAKEKFLYRFVLRNTVF